MRALIKQRERHPSRKPRLLAIRHLGDSLKSLNISRYTIEYHSPLPCICDVLFSTPGFAHEMSQQRDIGVNTCICRFIKPQLKATQ